MNYKFRRYSGIGYHARLSIWRLRVQASLASYVHMVERNTRSAKNRVPRGCGFKSHYGHYSPIVQLEEHQILNLNVAGSNPAWVVKQSF